MFSHTFQEKETVTKRRKNVSFGKTSFSYSLKRMSQLQSIHFLFKRNQYPSLVSMSWEQMYQCPTVNCESLKYLETSIASSCYKIISCNLRFSINHTKLFYKAILTIK